MSRLVGWYLFTDPFFELTYTELTNQGLNVSLIGRDEFEATVKSGIYEVDRSQRTILGTTIDAGLDRENRNMLITTDVPSTEKEHMPVDAEPKVFTHLGDTVVWNMRFGLAKKARDIGCTRILSRVKVDLLERERYKRWMEKMGRRKKQYIA